LEKNLLMEKVVSRPCVSNTSTTCSTVDSDGGGGVYATENSRKRCEEILAKKTSVHM
jgi:hypothetical protein